jgi:hypothetical protein
MLLGFIAPIAHLQDIDEPSDLSFALAHIAVHHSEYRRYFRNKSRDERLVMLDNGMWENNGVPMRNDRLIDLCRDLLPTEVYGPDYIYDSKKTIEEITKFAIQLKREKLFCCGNRIRVIGCVQGKTLQEWLDCYESHLNNEHVDVIAIPVLELSDFGQEEDPKFRWGRTRARIMRSIIKEYGLSKPIHLTGIDYPHELAHDFYRNDLIRSNDNKSPIVHGKFNILFDKKGKDWVGKIRSSVYGEDFFDWKLSPSQLADVKNNMDVMRYYVRRRVS